MGFILLVALIIWYTAFTWQSFSMSSLISQRLIPIRGVYLELLCHALYLCKLPQFSGLLALLLNLLP